MSSRIYLKLLLSKVRVHVLSVQQSFKSYFMRHLHVRWNSKYKFAKSGALQMRKIKTTTSITRVWVTRSLLCSLSCSPSPNWGRERKFRIRVPPHRIMQCKKIHAVKKLMRMKDPKIYAEVDSRGSSLFECDVKEMNILNFSLLGPPSPRLHSICNSPIFFRCISPSYLSGKQSYPPPDNCCYVTKLHHRRRLPRRLQTIPFP